MRILFYCVFFTIAACQGTARGQDPEILQTLEVNEHFGVSHPWQIIDFDVAINGAADKVHVVNDKGAPAVFQFLKNGKKVAVLTDLPAGETRRWHLRSGPGPDLDPGKLQVTDGKDHIQITNGLTGIRIPKPVRTPALPVKEAGERSAHFVVPCPVQGVLLRDGKWTGTGPNLLVLEAREITKMEVKFLERGPLKVVVEVQYDVFADAYKYGAVLVRPAGPGYYRSTITVQADQPSIMFEEDTDLNVVWSVDVFDGVMPTHGRYRGHSASKKEYGYEPGGETLRPGHAIDAQIDLDYTRPRISSYTTNDQMIAMMGAWNPWAGNTGWYWQLFNSQAPESANLVGAFVGRAGRALEPGCTGAGVFTKPGGPGGQERQAGFSFSSYRRGPDAVLYQRSRYQWGLFVSTKKDLLSPEQIQPINRQMNLHGGFNLNKISRYALDFADPPGGYGALYMDQKSVQTLKAKLGRDRLGPNGKGFHAYLYQAEPSSRALIDMWKDESKLRNAFLDVQTMARDMLQEFIHGEGIYSHRFHYWHGGVAMMRHGIWIDEILSNPKVAAENRNKIKAAAVLYGSVLWDNDFVPMDNHRGISMGTANMPVQQSGVRNFYALLLATHPSMTERARSVEQAVLRTVKTIVNENGAEIGCPHYVGASFAPTLSILMQIKQRGFQDPFESEPRLARFAEFYMNLLTPREPRVNGSRVLIALGDGSIEPSPLYGMLGTGFRDADPALAARLIGAWHANGKPHWGFYGTTLLMIDEDLPKVDPQLGDADFPGYYTVLRHGWGTPNESAVWLINGDHYQDHRHNDHGSMVVYALGQPLSVNWSSLYAPQTPGAYMHNAVVLEKNIGHAWDQDGCSLAAGGRWHNSSSETFVSYPEGAYTRAHFDADDEEATWTRAVTVVRSNPEVPIFLIRDTFSGEGSHEPKVLTMNFLARGDVKLAEETLSPTKRTHPSFEHKAGMELPSADGKFALKEGINRLGFEGRYPIDWDVFILSNEPQQGLIGNWAVTPHGIEIKDKEERQHILRVRGQDSFCTLIVAWRRGKKPADISVREEKGALVVTAGGKTVQFLPKGYSIQADGKTLERTYSSNAE